MFYAIRTIFKLPIENAKYKKVAVSLKSQVSPFSNYPSHRFEQQNHERPPSISAARSHHLRPHHRRHRGSLIHPRRRRFVLRHLRSPPRSQPLLRLPLRIPLPPRSHLLPPLKLPLPSPSSAVRQSRLPLRRSRHPILVLLRRDRDLRLLDPRRTPFSKAQRRPVRS